MPSPPSSQLDQTEQPGNAHTLMGTHTINKIQNKTQVSF